MPAAAWFQAQPVTNRAVVVQLAAFPSNFVEMGSGAFPILRCKIRPFPRCTMAILRSLTAVAAALTVSTIVPSAPGIQPASAADLVLVNGKIITVDGNDRIVQAVAIAGGKIVAVGTDDDIGVRIGPSTERIELAGRAVTPGLLDAHAHFQSGGVQRLFVLDVSFPAVKSIEDVGRGVRTQAENVAAGTWIEGRSACDQPRTTRRSRSR
jgi:Amidohydrolase family